MNKNNSTQDFNYNLVLPEQKKGRRSKIFEKKYFEDLQRFADGLLRIDKDVKDKYSSRGWCYLIEQFGLINKGQFDYAQKLINICRKNTMLPIDFTASDKSRSFDFVEFISSETSISFLKGWLENLIEINTWKDDVSFWESQEYYIQMIVEKIDVKTVFKPICKKYHIPIGNAKGWTDINARNDLTKRYIEAEKLGLKCVLLYFGDFDPYGLKITETWRKLLDDVKLATGYDPKNLEIVPVGISYKFIEDNNLIWIDNLISASGKKPDKSKQIIIDYIAKYGERKCEANIIIVPQVRKKVESLLIGTILKYLGVDCFKVYDKKMKEQQDEVKELMDKIDLVSTIEDLLEKLEDND